MTIRGRRALSTSVHAYEKSTGKRCSVRPEEVYEDMAKWESATCVDDFPKWSVYEPKTEDCDAKVRAEAKNLYNKLDDCYSRKVTGSAADC